MEEMDDDDFGDLYADVEALVSSVINGGGGGGGGGREITEVNNNNNHGGGGGGAATEKCDIGGGGGDGEIRGMEVNGVEVDEEEERVSLDEGSDSEDDLNIVLNEDDFRPVGVPVNGANRNGGFVGGGGNGNEKKGDDFVVGVNNGIGSDKNHGVKLEPAVAEGAGAVRGGNGRKGVSRPSAGLLHYKYITRRARTRAFRSTAKGNRFVGAKGDWKNTQANGDKFSGSSQVAHFKLPQKRTRTILNANINKFEQKPWRNSGVDVTDFFNFGFNEQSWKDYCSSMHQLQQQTSMQTRIPAHDYSKHYQASEARVEYEEMSEEGMVDETAQAAQGRTDSPDPNYVRPPKGRAIQVEGSIGERRSSMDVKHPLGLDPDVVIQITGQDTRKKYSGSEKKEQDHRYTALHEASENGEFGIAANKDTYSPHSVGGDKLSTESLEGSIRTSDRHAAALRRCSKQGVSFNPTHINSDNRGNSQLSDLERKHHKKFQFSEGNAKAMESLSKEKEVVHRNIHKKDPCMMETESSYGGQVQLSPSLSCYGSQSEASEDDARVGPGETQKPFRRPSQNSVAELRESNDPGYNFCRDSDSNSIRGKPGYFKEPARRNKSPIQERQNFFSVRPHGEADGGGGESPMSDKEVLYTRDHSHVIRGRQHGRLHGFGSYHKEETSFYREKYQNERFSDGHFRNANFKRPYMKHHPRFKNEAGPYFKRKFSDRGNFHDRRTTMGRDWYNRGRGFSNKDNDCPTHRERKWVSKFSFYRNKGKDPQWRRGDGHYFNKRNEGGDPWLEYGHADGFMQGKSRRAVPLTDRGCDCSDERCSQYAGSKVKNFGRASRFDDNPTSDMDYSRFKGLKNNGRRHVDRQLISSRFHRESHTMDGGRWPDTESPGDGDDADHLRLTDEHGRSRRGTYVERCQDSDRCGSYNDGDDAENRITSPSNQVPSGRNGYYKQSKAFHLTEDDLFSSNKDDKFYDEQASFSNKKISRGEQIHATNRSSHGRMIMDENLTEQHRYEMIRERNGAHFFNSSSNPTCSVKYEQTVLTCRDSVDLVAGEGKSSERCTEAGNVMCNDELENMGSQRDEEHTTSMEFNELQIEKVEIGSNQDIEEWLDKFPVLEDNEALDLEEGQIVTDELDLDFLMEEDQTLENASPTGNVRERMFDNENAANMNEVFGGIGQDRILQSLAKMEKRRERFKEPLSLRREPEKNLEPQVDPEVETAETNQHRPSRKRLWGGSYSPLHIGNSEHQVFFNET